MTSRDSLKGLRLYEFPRNAYQLVEDVRDRFGVQAKIHTVCYLNGSIVSLTLPIDQVQAIKSLARIRGVQM